MMIDVKGTKTQPQETDPAQRYVLKHTERKSKFPAIFGIFLVGIAVYLKSIFPGRAANPEEAGPSAEKELDSQDESKLAQTELETPPVLDDKPTGTVPGPQAPGGGGRLIDLAPPAEFVMIEPPTVANFRVPDPEGWWRKFQPLNLEALPANDNTDLAAHPANENSGGDDPQNYGGGGRDDDEDISDGTDAAGPDNQEPDPPRGEEEACVEEPNEPCEDPRAPNRAPRISGPVYLMDITGCAILAVALTDLLRNAMDPDGDVLAVKNLAVSSGTLSPSGDGWIFQSEPKLLGPVTITYDITDGQFTVAQTAHFSVGRSYVGGTDADDLLLGTMCADDVEGGAGDDNMDGRAGDDIMSGGAGNDHIVAGSGDDTVFAGDGDDIVFGGRGNDHISGGAGSDRLYGEEGDDVIFGDAGDDVISGGEGNDLLLGGTGNDTIAGGAGDDTISGGEGADILSGGSGNDTIDGGSGNDGIEAGDGNDTVVDGPGNDLVCAGAGDDTVVASADGDADVYDGGEGLDTLDYSAATMAVSVDLSAKTAMGADIGEDTVSGFESVIGGAGDDDLAGTECGDILQGNEGDDLLLGRGGDDTLFDGHGSDTVRGGDGDDTVVAAIDRADDLYDGGAGCDTLDYSEATEGIRIDLTTATACSVEIGEDSISGFETVIGGEGNDHFVVGEDAAVLVGGDGADIFEFVEPENAGTNGPVIHKVMDFEIGDRIRMSKYDLFEEVLDDLEDRFEDIYGDSFDDDDIPIRISRDWVEDMKRTVIEADLNRDDVYETTVTMQGHHVLVIVENA